MQAGCSKVFITSRKTDACTTACEALNALPNIQGEAIPVPADSSSIEGVEHLVKKVSAKTDHIDILLANAGATWGESFDTHPDKAFAKVMDLNVKSVFNTIRLCVQKFLRKVTNVGEGEEGGGEDEACGLVADEFGASIGLPLY